MPSRPDRVTVTVCPAIVGDASHDAMCLNEANPVVLECELRSPRALLSRQQPPRLGNCVMMVAEAGSPHMDFAISPLARPGRSA
jgi:hypothetical protein